MCRRAAGRCSCSVWPTAHCRIYIGHSAGPDRGTGPERQGRLKRSADRADQGINDHDPEEVVAFASKVCRPEADVLLCSCTAWRSLEAVAELERRTGKPVVSSNQASIWAAYRAIGLKPKITGFGRLLESLAA